MLKQIASLFLLAMTCTNQSNPINPQFPYTTHVSHTQIRKFVRISYLYSKATDSQIIYNANEIIHL